MVRFCLDYLNCARNLSLKLACCETRKDVILESLVEPRLRHFNISLFVWSLSKLLLDKLLAEKEKNSWNPQFMFLVFAFQKFMKCIMGFLYFSFWRCGTHWQPTNAWRRWRDTVELCWLCVHTSTSRFTKLKKLFATLRFAFRELCIWLTEQTKRSQRTEGMKGFRPVWCKSWNKSTFGSRDFSHACHKWRVFPHLEHRVACFPTLYPGYKFSRACQGLSSLIQAFT